MASDEELKSRVENLSGEKRKYERVRNSIRSHSLSHMRSLDDMNNFIDYCEKSSAL